MIDALHVWLCRNGDNVLGCCLIVDEGGFNAELALQIQLGKRRPRGHLLAQSLAAHLGIAEGAEQRSGRILRIAVHPEFQQQGIGQTLLASVQGWAASRYDFLGTSFGYVPELLHFWQRAGYQPIRLGLQKDAASGYPSLLCVLPISDGGQLWFPKARVLFASGVMANASEAFKEMPTEELLPLLVEAASIQTIPLMLPSEWVEQQLILFGAGGLGYELVLPALQQYIWLRLASTVDPLALTSLALVVAKVIQRKPWGAIVSQFNFTGRKHAERALRDIVSADLK